ncbi:MAG: SDR family oxidoreductase [Gammaproteobacteria bacterium]|nr:SDR family oxidoreductase [Gammaproteobacteria bacterium]
MKHFEIKDKTALVTGSNRGIGEGFVETLINAGAKKVYAAARDVDNLTHLAEKYPNIVTPVQLDVTNAEHINRLASDIEELDILVNNAGIANACNSSSENTLEIARSEMETNFFGPIQLTIAMLPALKKSKQAAIVNICSIASISNFPSIGPYSATKAAIHSFTQGLRFDLASDNIKVIGVYPGPIDTRLAAGWEMDKPKPAQVASRTIDALAEGKIDVMPDDFSAQMYATFLNHPHELEEALAQMQ